MKLTAAILLIAFSFSLGGVRLCMTATQRMARHRAVKSQRSRRDNHTGLEVLSLDSVVFANLDKEHLGQGVFEFEYQGAKYDAYQSHECDGQIHVLVKKDDADTIAHQILKHIKQVFGSKSLVLKNTVSNFYHGAFSRPLAHLFEMTTIPFSELFSSSSSAPLSIESPPPEFLN